MTEKMEFKADETMKIETQVDNIKKIETKAYFVINKEVSGDMEI